ncbi:beta-galactosidase [Pseudobythopirellula maris]|uniref:beta-galactosidase n=1 Tax=Pseudobythopirellula maris TaxID=2527991 RepID=UPI0018D3CD6E|nr:beta-galactosidase [Pseudobythopirellula maris]
MATVHEPAPPAAPAETFAMGAAVSPAGDKLTVDSQSLLMNGRRWMPAMGEFHFSRCPEGEWREELLKMRAGGVRIAATYVFWIHHQEAEGLFDWTGRRDLRRFAQLCQEAGLKLVVRIGPWCHGEVRGGGLPDWLLAKDFPSRRDDPRYLQYVRDFYGEIGEQLAGLMWKDGGPVVGVQLENEYRGRAEHLLTLKRLAREAGLDAPLYTRTGWPTLATPMPPGEILPLYGAYAEGFWDRSTRPMPGRYWMAFRFSPLRTDAAIATDLLGEREARDPQGVELYPFLTCELGGGMTPSYHRRVRIDPADVETLALVKLGSGGVLPGYYMYHGGENPRGELTTLQESQANGEWNDLPQVNYDFQAPIGQYGQLRPHYHALRRMHLWLDDWGEALAAMPPTLPAERPVGREDHGTLRWAVRSDGHAGFVFINNHERLADLGPKRGVRFEVELPEGDAVTLPRDPVDIAAGTRIVWPFGLPLCDGLRLEHATAQWVTSAEGQGGRTVFFAATPGVDAEFVLSGVGIEVESKGRVRQEGDQRVVDSLTPGRDVALTVRTPAGETVRIVLLSEADSLALWKLEWLGRERVLLTEAGLVVDGGALRLTSSDSAELAVGVWPADDLAPKGLPRAAADGVFARFDLDAEPAPPLDLVVEQVRQAGPPREIPLGNSPKPVAAAPAAEDFAAAARWTVRLPETLDPASDPLVRIHYVADVARVSFGDELVCDDFYHGRPLEIGLRRWGHGAAAGDLSIELLPLQRGAPIYLPADAWPAFDEGKPFARIDRVELVRRRVAELKPSNDRD